MTNPKPPRIVDHFATLAPSYDLVLSDVWGVVHNGMAAYPEAGEALARFRARGGTVVLVSNSPRPGAPVTRQLDRFGVIRAAYDAVVTSGDVTRGVLAERPGANVFHVGPERDLPIFEGLDMRFTALADADCVVCSGLFDDEVETPEDYRDLLSKIRVRGLTMVCANPDVVVERGAELAYCAGAIADLYAALGGEVIYAGKPYRPIYDLALAEGAAIRGAPVELARVLAIGDSVRTDFTGALALGIDCLFVTAGIHAEELGGRDQPDMTALTEIFVAAGALPKAVTRRLAW
jgi:HAD superfamily hydrolase (TIGR01459 family)